MRAAGPTTPVPSSLLILLNQNGKKQKLSHASWIILLPICPPKNPRSTEMTSTSHGYFCFHFSIDSLRQKAQGMDIITASLASPTWVLSSRVSYHITVFKNKTNDMMDSCSISTRGWESWGTTAGVYLVAMCNKILNVIRILALFLQYQGYKREPFLVSWAVFWFIVAHLPPPFPMEHVNSMY